MNSINNFYLNKKSNIYKIYSPLLKLADLFASRFIRSIIETRETRPTSLTNFNKFQSIRAIDIY